MWWPLLKGQLIKVQFQQLANLAQLGILNTTESYSMAIAMTRLVTEREGSWWLRMVADSMAENPSGSVGVNA